MLDMNVRRDPPPAIDLDDDDRPVGRVLSRREVLALFGFTSAAAFIAACAPAAVSTASPTRSASAAPATAAPATAAPATASPIATASPTPFPNPTPSPTPTPSPSPEPTPTPVASTAALPSCIVRPELTEGPFFVDERLERSDIRPDGATGPLSEGVPLGLTFAVARIDGAACVPFEGALVDVWHCDALGVYSGSGGTTFLRGYQVTDADGLATFTTVYPGWYRGRAVHIHFKIRSDAAAASGLEFTSQLFFPDELSAAVFALKPYAQNGQPDRLNAADGIFGQSGGQLTLSPTGSPANGLEAVFDIGVQTS